MRILLKGGSSDGDEFDIPTFQPVFESQTVKYFGPNQNPDGSWPEHPSGDYDKWYVPADIEVYEFKNRNSDNVLVYEYLKTK